MFFKVEFKETPQKFNVAFNEINRNFAIGFKGLQVVHDYGEVYEGDYNVIPKVQAQTMQTKDKHLTSDVTIEAIPFFEVSNPQNGKTIIIGGI